MSLVFLSYASEDDFTPDRKSGGWVTEFDAALRLELGRLKGVTLWRDNRDFNLPGDVREKLSEAVKQADFLLPVLSLDYNAKPYTRFEVSSFFAEMAKKGVEPTDYIVPVLRRPIGEDQILDVLSGLKCVSFFELTSNASYVPHVEPDGRKSEKFWAAIREVASLIEQQDKVRRQQEKPSATVYLARTASDQMDNQWTVSNELESRKCRVTPRPPWPVNSPDARVFLSNSLSEAQFSIHLLGATPGRELRSGLGELSTLQLALAADRQKKDARFRRLIWMPPDLKARTTDPTQKQLIESLEDGSGLSERDELVSAGIEQFKEIIHDELARVTAP